MMMMMMMSATSGSAARDVSRDCDLNDPQMDMDGVWFCSTFLGLGC